jgi:hypothetical protein
MSKLVWRCELCEKVFDTEEEAADCESDHVILEGQKIEVVQVVYAISPYSMFLRDSCGWPEEITIKNKRGESAKYDFSDTVPSSTDREV